MTIFRRAIAAAVIGLCLPVSSVSAQKHMHSADPLSTVMKSEDPLPGQTLSPSLMYQILASEIALQRGFAGTAYQTNLSLAHDTRDPRFARRAIEITLAMQMRAEALVAAQVWKELSPSSSAANQVLLALLAANDKWPEATALAQEWLDSVAVDKRGEEILQLQQMLRGPNSQAAAEAVRALSARDLKNPDVQLAIARAEVGAGNQALALEALNTALKLRRDHGPAVLLAALIESETNRSAAIERLREFLAHSAQQRDVRVALAQLLIADGQLESAQRELSTVLSLYPDDQQSMVALALVMRQRGNIDGAEMTLQQYLKTLSSRDGGVDKFMQTTDIVYQNLAEIAESRGLYRDAAVWLGQINSEEKARQAVPVRARLLARGGDIDSARALLKDLYDEAAAANDTPRMNAIARAEVSLLVETRNYEAAFKRYETLLKDRPDDADLLYEYAMVAERLKHFDVMEKSLRRVIKLQPDKAQAYNALGYTLAERNERLSEALDLINKALERAPDDAQIIDSLGWIHYRLGQKQEALLALQKAWGKLQDPEIAAHLGEVLWSLRRFEEALAIWRSGLARDANNEGLRRTVERYAPTLLNGQ